MIVNHFRIFRRKKFFQRAIFSSIAVIFALGLVLVSLSFGPFDKKAEKIIWGVTFSKPYAQGLGLDWKETYLAILDELNVKNLRIPAYWNELEGPKDVF